MENKTKNILTNFGIAFVVGVVICLLFWALLAILNITFDSYKVHKVQEQQKVITIDKKLDKILEQLKRIEQK